MIVPLDHTICEVSFTKHWLCVELVDGRTVTAPLEWFPLLHAAKPDQRTLFVIADSGLSVEWPVLGEKISADFLLARRNGGKAV